jgi:hypothetical protein
MADDTVTPDASQVATPAVPTIAGPSATELATMKAGCKKLYRIVWDPQTVYYVRELSRIEYRQIRGAVEKLPEDEAGQRGDELIVQSAVLWPAISPTDYSTSGCGYITSLAKLVLLYSGFRDPVEISVV